MTVYKLKKASPIEIQTQLLNWFNVHGRKNLPWQGKNSYFVWISEIMLQQTQVIKVIDYFNRFIEKFPTLKQLALADESDVLQLWSGLGYYNRARNLHKTATICLHQHNAHLPENLQQLMALPGIGKTTAAAILSLALNHPHAILDGNVKRVISRVFAIKAPTMSQLNHLLWTQAENCMEQIRARDYNQALMDLGSLVCSRTKPKCEACPFSGLCCAHIMEQVHHFPQKSKATKKQDKRLYTVMLINNKQLFLKQRLSSGIWPQLWFLPCYESSKELINEFRALNAEKIKQVKFSIRHILTHRNLLINVSCINITSIQKRQLASKGQWIQLSDFKSLPHPKALDKIIDAYVSHN